MELFGREELLTCEEEITAANVVNILNAALAVHARNRSAIQYLYQYVRGEQPVLHRSKKVRPEICNKVVVNRALEITEFKTSYLLGEPCQYVRKSEKCNTKELSKLNELMGVLGKSSLDMQLAFWFHICGVGYRIILPTSEGVAIPFQIHILDPRDTFVVYWAGVSRKPVMGVHYVKDVQGNIVYSVYTEREFFEIRDSVVVKKSTNGVGRIPIVEYRANDLRQGAFEPVVPILDVINVLESNRVDGIEQFVQSFIKFVNCQITKEQFEEFKELGALMLKSDPTLQADVDIVSAELNQTQAQALIDDLDSKVRSIVGMPSRSDGTTSDSSNNGAVIMRNGWEDAEARAKQTESKFSEAENISLQIMLQICKTLGYLQLENADVGTAFTRRNYTDIQTKAQVLVSMLSQDKISPEDAYASCGMFTDPNAAYRRGMKYYEEQKALSASEGTKNKSQTETTDQTENKGGSEAAVSKTQEVKNNGKD